MYNNFFIDGAFHTAKVDSYLPNDYGLYCMSGNVAEMVTYWKDKSVGTKGGSWTSDLDELKITGEDKFKGITKANPNIGFRVVMTYFIKKKGKDQSYIDGNKIKITKSTTKAELEKFKTIAEQKEIKFDYKVRTLNHKIWSLTINVDADNDPKNCGGVYFKGSISDKMNYVEIGWIEKDDELPELYLNMPQY